MDKYVKPEIINLKNCSEINEKWVQAKIAEDPSILNLGELILKDSERIQPTGGRLDLLLMEPESNTRYEVELQLGKCDESHIIRTIEYWDVERKRYPQYKHCAVIIAEDITSRFLNVISLFNGNIPIIAIQMKALKVGDSFSLFFTTVLDALSYGTEEDDSSYEATDRKFWEKQATSETVMLADQLLKISESIAPGYNLKYNKYYIGLNKDGISQNFISFTPRKKSIILNLKLKSDKEIDEILDNSDLDVLTYDRQFNQYRVNLKAVDITNNTDLLLQLIKKAYDEYML